MDKRDRKKLEKMNRGPVAKIWDKVEQLWRFIWDPKAPKAGKAIAIGALTYLLWPLDAVPDFIIPAGLLDDVSVILAACAKLAIDLQRYRGNGPAMPGVAQPRPLPPSPPLLTTDILSWEQRLEQRSQDVYHKPFDELNGAEQQAVFLEVHNREEG